jgi:WD40 repeat protein
MGQVFLSYSRSDTVWVSQLVARLERRGHTAWVDQRDIPASLPWLEEVREAILGSDVFVICDSSASRNSASCSAESAFAFDAAKQACTVDVGGEVAEAEHIVVEALSALTPGYLVRTELAVLARDWERAGRPAGGLVSARHRRRLSAGNGVPPALRRGERAFLRASRTRSQRRLAVTVTVALLAGGSVLAGEVFKAARERITTENSLEAEAFTVEKQQLQNAATLPFQGLAEAAQSGGSEAAVHAGVVSAALRYPVPDDSFTVPAAATGFAPSQAGGMVTVLDGHGHAWGRVADATSVRTASPVAPPAAGVSHLSAGGLRFRERRATGMVEVLREGHLWRTILYVRAPTALALSPDGRELAAGVGDVVAIADLDDGAVRTVLRGVPGDVRDLMWAPDGAQLWALTDGKVVSWPVRDGNVLIDEPAQAFQAILPSSRPNAVWVVARDGDLRELNFTSGETLARLHVPDTINSAGGSPDGSIAALSGMRGEWILPLSKSSPPRLLALPDCSLGRPAFGDASIVYVPCLSSVLLTVSVAQAQVVARTTLDQFGVNAVKVVPGTGTLLVGDVLGHLFEGSPSSGFHQIWASGCGASILRIGLAPDRGALTTAGSGTGTIGCTARGLRGDEPRGAATWQFDAVLDPSLPSILAESVAFSTGGHVFAYGFSDGTIALYSTVNILPTLTLTTIDGAIRDMYVTTNDELLVATDAGIIQRIPLCDTCVSDRYLAGRAAAELARSSELGLTRRVPVPAP